MKAIKEQIMVRPRIQTYKQIYSQIWIQINDKIDDHIWDQIVIPIQNEIREYLNEKEFSNELG